MSHAGTARCLQAGLGAGAEALLAIGGDALAEALDKKLGATVSACDWCLSGVGREVSVHAGSWLSEALDKKLGAR